MWTTAIDPLEPIASVRSGASNQSVAAWLQRLPRELNDLVGRRKTSKITLHPAYEITAVSAEFDYALTMNCIRIPALAGRTGTPW